LIFLAGSWARSCHLCDCSAASQRYTPSGGRFKPDSVREKIRAAQLINRLQAHIFDGLELSAHPPFEALFWRATKDGRGSHSWPFVGWVRALGEASRPSVARCTYLRLAKSPNSTDILRERGGDPILGSG
jgi:hypothetical protein